MVAIWKKLVEFWWYYRHVRWKLLWEESSEDKYISVRLGWAWTFPYQWYPWQTLFQSSFCCWKSTDITYVEGYLPYCQEVHQRLQVQGTWKDGALDLKLVYFQDIINFICRLTGSGFRSIITRNGLQRSQWIINERNIEVSSINHIYRYNCLWRSCSKP